MSVADQPGEAVALWLLDRKEQVDRLAAIERATPRLADDEIARAGAMPDRHRAGLWRSGRTALRLLLERVGGAQIRRQPFVSADAGRPALACGRIEFSIADSGDYLLLAVSTVGRIGVDIELPRVLRMAAPRIDRLIASAEAMGSPSPSPLQAWTRIEAFAKAAGPSLAATLARLGIQGHGDGLGGLAPTDIRGRTVTAVRQAGLVVFDLPLPHGLTGALARPSARHDQLARPIVRALDRPAIDQLAAS